MMSDAFAGGTTTYVGGGGDDQSDQTDTDTPTPETEVGPYPTGMNAADNLSNYPGFTNAMHFNGDFLRRQFDKAPTSETTMTYSSWIKFTEPTLQNFGIAAGAEYNAGTAPRTYMLYRGNEPGKNFNVDFYDSGSTWYSNHTEAAISDFSSWYHYVMTIDGSTIKLYLNGKEMPISSSTPTPIGVPPSGPTINKN